MVTKLTLASDQSELDDENAIERREAHYKKFNDALKNSEVDTLPFEISHAKRVAKLVNSADRFSLQREIEIDYDERVTRDRQDGFGNVHTGAPLFEQIHARLQKTHDKEERARIQQIHKKLFNDEARSTHRRIRVEQDKNNVIYIHPAALFSDDETLIQLFEANVELTISEKVFKETYFPSTKPAHTLDHNERIERLKSSKNPRDRARIKPIFDLEKARENVALRAKQHAEEMKQRAEIERFRSHIEKTESLAPALDDDESTQLPSADELMNIFSDSDD